MTRHNRSGNPAILAVGAVFIAVFIAAGVLVSRSVAKNQQAAQEPLYSDAR